MKYLSLFSGIGGFELGIKQAYEDIRQGGQSEQLGNIRGHLPDLARDGQNEQYPSCIGFSEIDKYAVQIYQSHFPEHKNYGDITKINEAELPDFDLLVGGFPCQSFSIAGKRGGFNDTRGTLFFEIARILKHKQPHLLLLENVKGLLSHDEGRTFATIISTLDELGYDLQWQVLNSKNFGVPQNRERVFIVGHLRGTSRPKIFPIGNDNKEIAELSGHYANTLKANAGGAGNTTYIANTLTRRYEGAQAVGTYIGEGKLNAQEIRAVDTKNVGAPRFTENVATLGANDYKEPKQVMVGAKIRRLTPTECERLQGFPDGWTEGVSDTQRYKCLGNAVTVNVIKAIVDKFIASHSDLR